MTPYEHVWSLVQDHLLKANSQWHALAQATEVSENTLRYSILNQTARHRTLHNIVHKLEGPKAASHFLLEYQNELKGLAVEVSVAKAQQLGTNKHSPEVMQQKIHEIIMCAEATEGVAYDELLRILPHRKKLVDRLIAEGLLENVEGRIYAHYTTSDPDLTMQKIKLKAEIIGNSSDEYRAGLVSSMDDLVSLEGYVELTRLTEKFIAESIEIVSRSKSRYGVSFTLSTFLTTMGLEHHTKAAITEVLGENREN
ncbi:MAG: hypothetical protein HRU19_29505 [Pseudobacteriovorax sp.]|nr:hypothetical protein [Pseudobacteriovorax sp.]